MGRALLHKKERAYLQLVYTCTVYEVSWLIDQLAKFCIKIKYSSENKITDCVVCRELQN